MVNGIEKFTKYFAGFEDMYSIIGGVACWLLMTDADLDFRATKDFDMVLIVESITEDFGKAFWSFINDGGYSERTKSNGEPEFYRFINPSDKSFPAEVELFSRKSNVIDYPEVSRLTPIHISDEISSLSAILLDDEYYSFLKNGRIIQNSVRILDYNHIIPFKAKAWLDLKKRKEDGESIDSKKIAKHRNDIFRLSQLLSESDSVELPDGIKADMALFLSEIKNEIIDLKNLGIPGKQNDYMELLKKVFHI